MRVSAFVQVVAALVLGLGVILLIFTVAGALRGARRHRELIVELDEQASLQGQKSRQVYRRVHGVKPPGWTTDFFLRRRPPARTLKQVLIDWLHVLAGLR